MKLSILYNINGVQFEKILRLSRVEWSDKRVDWKKQIPSILGFANTMKVAEYTRKGDVIEVTLINRKDFSLDSDMLFKIGRYCDTRTYNKLWVASSLLMSTEETKFGFELHDQNPGFWQADRITDSQQRSAIASLAMPANQIALLATMNTWLGSEAGVRDLYDWISRFAEDFTKYCDQLQDKPLELQVIYALVASVDSLWKEVNEQGKSENYEVLLDFTRALYPAVHNSLEASYMVLCAIYDDDALDKSLWERHGLVCPLYWNLQGLGSDEPFDFEKAYFPRVNLNGADLSGADLKDAYFKNASFVNAALSDATLTNANFTRAKLDNANCEQADCRSTNFTRASLVQVRFAGADLYKTNFQDATLKAADFVGAQCQCINFSGANLLAARFSGAITSAREIRLDYLEQIAWLGFKGANFLGAWCDAPFIMNNIKAAKHESFKATLASIKVASAAILAQLQEHLDSEHSVFKMPGGEFWGGPGWFESYWQVLQESLINRGHELLEQPDLTEQDKVIVAGVLEHAGEDRLLSMPF